MLLNARGVSDVSEQSPSTLLLHRHSIRLRLSLQLAQTLDLLQHQLQHVFPADHIKMSPDPGIFSSESLDLRIIQMTTQPHIQLAGEVVVELGKKFDVEEEHGRRGQFVGDHIEEDLRAVVFVLTGGALSRFDRCQSHLDGFRSIAEKDGFTACKILNMNR